MADGGENESRDVSDRFCNFLSSVLDTKHIGRVHFTEGSIGCQIKADVTQLATSIGEAVTKLDDRFKSSIFPSGSSVENTKVGLPDEFDFMFVLENFNELIDLENIDQETGLGNFIALKAIPNVPDEYQEFVKDGYLSSAEIQYKFSMHVQTAIMGGDLMEQFPHLRVNDWWKGGNTTSTEMNIEWVRCSPHHTISLDLVASMYIPKWLGGSSTENQLITEEVIQLGCHVVYKNTEFFSMPLVWDAEEDAPLRSERSDLKKGTVWRLSFSSAELFFFNQLKAGRDAYTLAKIFFQMHPSLIRLMNDLYHFCMQRDEFEIYMERMSDLMMFLREKRSLESPYAPPSYTLKNVYFSILEQCRESFSQMEYGQSLLCIFEKIMSIVENWKENQHIIQPWFFNKTVNLKFDMDKLDRVLGTSCPLFNDLMHVYNHTRLLRKIKLASSFFEVAINIMSNSELRKKFKMDDTFLNSLPSKIEVKKPPYSVVIDEGPVSSNTWEQNLYLMLVQIARFFSGLSCSRT